MIKRVTGSGKHQRAQELTLQVALGIALAATKGNAAMEVERVYNRAYELCQQVGESTQLLYIMNGLRGCYQVRGDFKKAQKLGEEMVALTQDSEDASLVVAAQSSLGHTLYTRGAFLAAREHLEKGKSFYGAMPDEIVFLYGGDPRVFNSAPLSWTLWHLGYPDQAVACAQESLVLVRNLSHAPSLEHVLSAAAKLHQLRREPEETRTYAAAAMRLSQEHSLQMRLAIGLMYQGWSNAMQGKVQEGIAQLRQGFADLRGTGGRAFGSYYLAMLVEACIQSEDLDTGLDVVAEALLLSERQGGNFSEAELHRLKGELLLASSEENYTEVETCLHSALDIARSQQAKSLELRAATSLASLWQSQDKRQDAYDLLSPVYNWFTEGFDTADLIDAKALLDELSEGTS